MTAEFPPCILALLRYVADRNPPPGKGVYQDEHGEPMQDDADAALAWIAARSDSPLATQGKDAAP